MIGDSERVFLYIGTINPIICINRTFCVNIIDAKEKYSYNWEHEHLVKIRENVHVSTNVNQKKGVEK